MKKAGYPSGKYSGPALLAVGDSASPAKETAEAFVQQVKQLGFNVTLTEVPHKTMYSKFCQVPKSEPAFCPNMAWGKDFFDSQSMTDPLLNGKNIATAGNSNTALVNNPSINSALDSASKLTDASARAQAYANIDKMATDGAYYVDWIWDNQVNLESSDVNGVYNKQNTDWDFAFTSMK
jgi:peptide/nickel transport system substrate-binding protein